MSHGLVTDRAPGVGPATPVRVALRVAGALLVLGITVSAGALLGWGLTREASTTPTSVPNAVDAGFSRDMQDHHAQAVRMSVLVLERTEDQQVRDLATDIMLTQQQQTGQMYGWLQQWGLPQSSVEEPMAWMSGDDTGMGGMHGSTSTGTDTGTETGTETGTDTGTESSGSVSSMPGMASTQDLARLDQASGSEADRLYLQLMIPHHQGGVEMAEAARDAAAAEVVRRLAGTVVRSQSAEIAFLTTMLDDRGGPLP